MTVDMPFTLRTRTAWQPDCLQPRLRKRFQQLGQSPSSNRLMSDALLHSRQQPWHEKGRAL